MKQTLFVIPTEWFGIPMLIGWLVLGALIMLTIYLVKRDTKEVIAFLPIFGIVAIVVYYLLPNLQITGINPDDPGGDLIPLGLAIRGYGMFMLLAIVSAVGLALWRCHQIGFDADRLISLVFWMIICGIIGARVYYVVQYWDDYSADTTRGLITKLLDMTKGGLVVYGSLIGGLVAVAIYSFATKLNWRLALDVLAPSMVLGLAIGRIGCLMNGCCYGGLCESEFGVQFPAGSPPYMRQLAEGTLLGIESKVNEKQVYPVEVVSVEDDSTANRLNIKPGDQLAVAGDDPTYVRAVHEQKLEGFDPQIRVIKSDGQELLIAMNDLPAYSRKVHPTQIYSAINGFLMCAFLWFYFPFRRFQGELFALLIIIYPIARFILELIRVDEGGQLNTEFTTAQWISFLAIATGIACWLLLRWKTKENPPLSMA